jgi:hypothetical protein
MTQCEASGKSQPIPPVAENAFHLTGIARCAVPSLAMNVGS